LLAVASVSYRHFWDADSRQLRRHTVTAQVGAVVRLLCHATASLTNQFGQFRHDAL
jgi:hypothetical protein